MAEVINVRPVGVQVTISFTAEELQLLQQAYDHCEILLDIDKPEEKIWHDYFVNVHAPFITETLDNLKKQGII